MEVFSVTYTLLMPKIAKLIQPPADRKYMGLQQSTKSTLWKIYRTNDLVSSTHKRQERRERKGRGEEGRGPGRRRKGRGRRGKGRKGRGGKGKGNERERKHTSEVRLDIHQPKAPCLDPTSDQVRKNTS